MSEKNVIRVNLSEIPVGTSKDFDDGKITVVRKENEINLISHVLPKILLDKIREAKTLKHEVKRKVFKKFQCNGSDAYRGVGCLNIATVVVCEPKTSFTVELEGFKPLESNNYCTECLEKKREREEEDGRKEILYHREIDTSSLVQCVNCSNFIEEHESWEMGFSNGRCKFGKQFEQFQEHLPVQCNTYNKNDIPES